eukprot:gb/GECG01016821.1/.p1 GENE.gb/GECG01016821.1/~~gb/GECG01016821.1/.p1  ORF type:complete len:1017 (+),score=139.58 gb/GECG01016821.1/:1-3051(+)
MEKEGEYSAQDTEFLRAISALADIHLSILPAQKKKLFGLYKQAMEGDVGESPPANNVIERREYEARVGFRGMRKEEAKQQYIDTVDGLVKELHGGDSRGIQEYSTTIDGEEKAGDEAEEEGEDASDGNGASIPPGEHVMRRISDAVFHERPEEHERSDRPLSKEGILYKQRDVRSVWAERLFVLKGKSLSYYRSTKQKEPTKKWILGSTCKVQELPREFSKSMIKKKYGKFFPFAVSQHDMVPPMRLAAASKDERYSWMKVIRRAAQSTADGPATPTKRNEGTSVPFSDRPNGTANKDNKYAYTHEETNVVSNAEQTSAEIVDSPMSGGSEAQNEVYHCTLEEIAAPYPPEPYTKDAQKMMNDLQKLEKSKTEWKYSKERKGVYCYHGTGDLAGAKGTGFVNFSRRAIRDMLVDLEKKPLTDSKFDDGRVIERLDSRSTVTYMRYKAVMPTSARDFCNFTHWRVATPSEEEGGTLYIAAKSVKHPECPEDKDCVRADLKIGGWVIRPIKGKKIAEERAAARSRGEDPGPWPTDVDIDSEGCECTYLVLIDLCGDIPGFVVGIVTQQQALLVAALREALEKEWKGKDSEMRRIPTIHNFDKDDNPPVVAPAKSGTKNPGPKKSETEPAGTLKDGGGVHSQQSSNAPEAVGTETSDLNIPGLTQPLPIERPPHQVSVFSALVLLVPAVLVYAYGEMPYHYREQYLTPLNFLIFLGVISIFCLLLFRRLWVGPSNMSIRRKLTIATWTAPQEGNIYGALSVDVGKARQYIEDVRTRTGTKVTMTHLVVKALGTALRACPAINGRIVDNEYIEAGRVDVSCLINIQAEGDSSQQFQSQRKADLGNVKVTDVDQKTVVDIAQELSEKAKKLRAGKDSDFEKTKTALKMLPVGVLRYVVSTAGYLGSQLGCTIPFLGVRPYPFGTACVSSIGSLGLDFGWAPFTPFANVPVLITVGAIKDSVVAEKGSPVVRPIMMISATLDHRYMDGSQAALLGDVFKRSLENPSEVMEKSSPPIGSSIGT